MAMAANLGPDIFETDIRQAVAAVTVDGVDRQTACCGMAGRS